MDPQVAGGDDEFFDFPEDSSSSETINEEEEEEEVQVKTEPVAVVDEEELKKQQAARFAQLALKTSHKKADASDLEELFFNYCKYTVYLHVYGRPTPLERTDSDALFLHKSLGAFFHFQSDLFVKQLRPLQERLRSGVRAQLLQRVDGDEKDPLVVFFDAMCHHREMHMVNPKTNPIRSRKQTSADELVTTIIDSATKTAIEFDLTGKNHGKRELTLSQLPSDDDSGAIDSFQAGLDHRLAMTANGEKEHKLMSIMVPHDLANVFRIIHSFIHFFNIHSVKFFYSMTIPVSGIV